MNRDNLIDEIQKLSVKLIKLAENKCWNTISYNLTFIVSDFNEFGEDFRERRRYRNEINKSKQPQTLEKAIEILKNEFDDLYDVNLYIFKALKKETIIEIQYYRKSNMEPDYFEKIKDNPPMLHSKVVLPSYALDGQKFDVNWESGVD